MSCIKKIQIENTIYEAKTDFKTAIKCNEIATNENIGNLERALGVICTMFGGEGLNNPNHYEKLLKWVQKYLSCGEEVKQDGEADMDYIEDWDYIVASFQSDYGMNLDEVEMDWQRFNTLINGLSNSEMGNCCILNRVRNLRNFDLKTIKDQAERKKIIKAKQQVALKKHKKKKIVSDEEKKSAIEFYKMLKMRKE